MNMRRYPAKEIREIVDAAFERIWDNHRKLNKSFFEDEVGETDERKGDEE